MNIEYNKNIDFKKAYEYSLFIISKCDKTSNEIRHKLIKKGYSDPIINEVIDKLILYALIDDRRYVRMWIEYNKNKEGISYKAIINKLLIKGIDRSLIEEEIGEINIDEYTSALKFAQKRIKNYKETEKNMKKKLYESLIRKGFNYGISKRVCEEILDNYEI